MTTTQFPITTICGSMRYYDQMLKLAAQLTGDGWIVLMPYVAEYIGGRPADSKKEMLDDMHRTKISMSERIYVVGSHIGESTSKEIFYAVRLRLPITMLDDNLDEY